MSCALSLLGADFGTTIGASDESSSSTELVSAMGAVAGTVVETVVCCSALAPAGASSPYGR